MRRRISAARRRASEPCAGAAAAVADAPAPRPGGSLTRATARLSLAQVIVFAGGIVSGPLLARALGATGRGHLAAIIVPVTMLGWLAGLGLGSWVTVETARGRALGAVLGTAGLLSTGLAIVGGLAAIPVAIALSGGNDTVLLFMIVGIATLPLSIYIQLIGSAAIGCSRWKMQARSRTIPAVTGSVLTVLLFVTDRLTLSTAAAVFVVSGMLSAAPLIALLREARPLSFERGLARQAIGFGARAWATSLGALTNARLDQLLMIPLVPTRQLGLYAVAVTYATLPTVVSSALMVVIGPRVALGDHALVGRSLRITIALMTVAGGGLALLAPIVLPLAFGSEFAGAVPMALILIAAGVPLAGTVVLTSAMTSLGRPGTPAVGQIMGGVLTLVGLLVLLPVLQAVGAALVSLIAYSVTMVFMLVMTARHLDSSVRFLLKPQRSDLAWAAVILRSLRARGIGSRASETDSAAPGE